MASQGGGTDTTSDNNVDILGLSAEIVAAYVGQNTVSQTAIPDLIRTVHQALASLGNGGEAPQPAEKAKPAVPVGRSVQHDFIVCLEDGKKLKMLKRYLRSRYKLSPSEYRERWNLPPNYPMVAPNYAQKRSDFAKKIGLGKGDGRKGKKKKKD